MHCLQRSAPPYPPERSAAPNEGSRGPSGPSYTGQPSARRSAFALLDLVNPPRTAQPLPSPPIYFWAHYTRRATCYSQCTRTTEQPPAPQQDLNLSQIDRSRTVTALNSSHSASGQLKPFPDSFMVRPSPRIHCSAPG